MMIKTILPILLCLVFIGIGYINFTDASKSSQLDEKQVLVQQYKEPSKVLLSEADKKLIEEYNKIFDDLQNGSPENYHKKLKAFLAKAQLIKNDQQRNNTFMNIYMQLGMYKEAYELNEKLIIEKPIISRYIFRCQLMEFQKESITALQQCHAIAGKNIFEALDKKSPSFQYDELAYFIEMYKAGYDEYGNKIKTSINAIKDEEIKLRFLDIYEEIIRN